MSCQSQTIHGLTFLHGAHCYPTFICFLVNFLYPPTGIQELKNGSLFCSLLQSKPLGVYIKWLLRKKGWEKGKRERRKQTFENSILTEERTFISTPVIFMNYFSLVLKIILCCVYSDVWFQILLASYKLHHHEYMTFFSIKAFFLFSKIIIIYYKVHLGFQG